MSKKINFILAFAVFVLSLGISVFYGSEVRFPDEQDYINLGFNIYSGSGFVGTDGNATASRPVMLPLLVSLGYSLSLGVFFVKILNALAVSCSGLLLAMILERYFPNRGWIPQVLIMGNPLIMFSSSLLAPQTIGTFFLLLIIYLVIQDGATRRYWTIIGLASAVLLSLIPAMILSIPLILLVGFLQSDFSITERLKKITYAGLVCVVLLMPWAVRNLIQMDTFTPFSTQGGYNLILAFSENSTPTSGAEIDLSEFINDKFYMMTEVERNSYLTKQAVTWIQENPWRAANLYFGRVVNYFASSNELATESQRSSFRDLVLFLSFYSLIAIALLRLPLIHRAPFEREEVFLWAVYFGNAFASAIFLTRIRYRSPFDAILVLMVSFSLCYLHDYWQNYWNRKVVESGE